MDEEWLQLLTCGGKLFTWKKFCSTATHTHKQLLILLTCGGNGKLFHLKYTCYSGVVVDEWILEAKLGGLYFRPAPYVLPGLRFLPSLPSLPSLPPSLLRILDHPQVLTNNLFKNVFKHLESKNNAKNKRKRPWKSPKIDDPPKLVKSLTKFCKNMTYREISPKLGDPTVTSHGYRWLTLDIHD